MEFSDETLTACAICGTRRSDARVSGLSRVLVFAMLLSLAFAPAACGDESTVRDPNRGVFKVNRCGKGCECLARSCRFDIR